MDPPVSVPVAQGTSPAPTAAADPPEEPPGARPRSHGLRAGPNQLVSLDDPMANSSMFVLPRHTVPAADSRATTVAS